VAACVALLAVVGSAAGTSRAQAPLQRVTIFGDSQLTAVTGTPRSLEMLQKGIDLDLRTAVCRRLVQESCPFGGVRPTTVQEEINDTGKGIGQVVVLLVGYNDYEAEWVRNIGIIMRALLARNVNRVLWLTLTERRDDWVRMNDDLQSATKDWPQLEVLDWRDAADPSWFQGSDIHLTGEGAFGLASYIHVALFARGIAAPTTPAEPPRVALRISVRGAGAVTARGVKCRTACTQLVPVGTVVQLSARAPAGSVFARWSGACAGTTPTCSRKLVRNASVVARFRAKPKPTPA
jgi:hypothetical protein